MRKLNYTYIITGVKEIYIIYMSKRTFYNINTRNTRHTYSQIIIILAYGSKKKSRQSNIYMYKYTNSYIYNTFTYMYNAYYELRTHISHHIFINTY